MLLIDINFIKDTPPWEWPPAAKAVIAGTLKDKSRPEADRALAASFAGDLVVMDDDLAADLLTVLLDPSELVEVRASAAIAFGPALEAIDADGFEDPYSEPPVTEPVFERIQRTLRSLYDDATAPTEIRRRALEASVRASEDWHDAAVRAAYQSPEDPWKVTALFCMRYLPDFDEEILHSLQSANNEILAEAMLSAGERGIQDAWPRISDILSGPENDRHVLLSAIAAAANMHNEDAGEILRELQDSDDEEISEAAESALEERSMFGDIDEEDFDDDLEDDDFDDEDTGRSNNGHAPKP